MTTVVEELVEGHRYTDVLSGFEIIRIFRVGDLVDVPNRQLIEAVNDPAVPLLGATYPGTTGILCVKRDVSPDGPNAARVVLTYSAEKNVSTFNQPEPTTNEGQDVKQISSGTRELTTVFTSDTPSQPMVLAPPLSFEGLPPYLSEAKVLVPAGEIVFERVEKSPAATAARNLVGKLNEFAVSSWPARSLLFVNLDAISNDGGYLWNCTYTFRYDFGTWLHRDAYHAPDGRVPADAVTVSWNVLFAGDFSVLNLDFSDVQIPVI